MDTSQKIYGIHRQKKRAVRNISSERLSSLRAAATYSPTVRSTIGADGLNFSVRNGKRWDPVTITTIMNLTCFYLFSHTLLYFLSSPLLSTRCYPFAGCCSFALKSKTSIKRRPAYAHTTHNVQSFGQLVVLGFDVTVFTPAPYLRRRLQRPSKEI